MRIYPHNLTQWIPAILRPTIPGIYQRIVWSEVSHPRWAYFDGTYWHRAVTKKANARNTEYISTWQTEGFWRGLNFNPSKHPK